MSVSDLASGPSFGVNCYIRSQVQDEIPRSPTNDSTHGHGLISWAQDSSVLTPHLACGQEINGYSLFVN